MPLYILAPLVIIGVTAVVWLVHLAGGSAQPQPLTLDAAARELAHDYPDFSVTGGVVSTDGQTVLLIGNNSPELALALQFGRNTVTRILHQNTLVSSHHSDHVLHLQLLDFTLPRVAIHLADDQQAKSAATRLAALQKETA